MWLINIFWPDCSGVTKKRFISDGQENGCFLFILFIKPSNKLPLEKATFANRAVDTLKLFSLRGLIFPLNFLKHP